MSGATRARPIRLGIVGCGAVVREVHLPVIAGHPDLDVTMLCDLNRNQAMLARRQFGLQATITQDVGELAGKVDAALVAVSPRFHAPVTLELLERGIDVLCEKPLATTAADGNKMAEAAARTGRVLAVALMSRFFPHNEPLRELVHDGELGEIQEVVAEDGAPLGWTMTSNAYFDRKTTAGGVFFDAGVHLLDRVLWLFGDLTDRTYEDDSYGGVETNARLRGYFQLANQRVPARIELSWSHALGRSIRVVGSEATLEAHHREPHVLTVRRRTRKGTRELQLTCARSWSSLGAYHAQIADFVRAVRERRAPFVTADSAVKALAVIEDAYANRTRMAQPWVERGGQA